MSVTRRRVAVALVALLGLPVVAAAIAIAAVALLDASIDVSRWRTALAERAGAALGRPVRVDGPLELRLGREAELGIGALGIGHAPGHAASDLATLDGVRVRIDLPAALRGRLRLRALDIAAVRVRLERTDDGGARLPGARPPAEETQTTAPAAPHLEHLTIRRLVVERADARGDARPLIELEQLVASEERGGALKAAARARARGSPTCSIAVEGAASHVLRAADRPWPFTLELGCPRTRLHASGRLERGRRAVRASFGAGVESLEDIESALGRALPKLAAAALAGELVATADVIELAELRGRVGDAVVTGALALHLGGARARLTGELTADALDLQHLLAGATPRDGTLLDDEALARQALPLRDAPAVDAELVLRARHLVGLGVQDARLDLEADARGVRAPIAATVGGVPLAGRIELAVAAAAPEVSLEVEANDVPLATLARSFDGAAGVEGRLGRLALRLVSRGDTLGALARDLDLRLEVASARLRARPRAGGRPFEMRLDALELAAPRGQPLRGTARGALLGEPVRLKLRGGTVAQILREQATPVALELAAREATARVSGTLARPDAARDLDLAFRLAAPRAGDLARRAGVDPEAGPPRSARAARPPAHRARALAARRGDRQNRPKRVLGRRPQRDRRRPVRRRRLGAQPADRCDRAGGALQTAGGRERDLGRRADPAAAPAPARRRRPFRPRARRARPQRVRRGRRRRSHSRRPHRVFAMGGAVRGSGVRGARRAGHARRCARARAVDVGARRRRRRPAPHPEHRRGRRRARRHARGGAREPRSRAARASRRRHAEGGASPAAI
ncbi:MAG: hypothetical protein M5U08_24610 [Burkholderiales bacterium]|nr:hypothetical protein [Burkholderiales bacterium]